MTPKRIALLLIVALAGCGRGEGGPGGAGGGFEMPPTPVETAEVVAGSVENVFTTLGTLEAAEQVTIVAEISGIVERIPFREGQLVKRGELLVKLEDVELDAQYRRAEAVADQRRLSYERWKTVVEAKAGAAQDLDDAHAALRVAEAEATLSREMLSRTRIEAPMSGWIGPRLVSPGAYVRAGDAIAELAQMDRLEVHFSMPERYIPQIKRGAEVLVSAPAYPGEDVRGKIDVVDPVVDPRTRNVGVIATFANREARFRAGMSADVRVVLSSREAALTVPAEAVFAEGTEFLVYKVGADGTVERTPVTLGTRLADVVEVTSGLAAGDVVVRAGQQKLFPGAKVMPVGAGAPPGGPGGPEGTTAPADSAGAGAATS